MEDLIFFEKHGYPVNFKYNTQLDETKRWEGKLIFDENSTDTFKTLSLHLFEKLDSFEASALGISGSIYKNTPNKKLNFHKGLSKKYKITNIETYDSSPQFYMKKISGKNFHNLFPVGTTIKISGVTGGIANRFNDIFRVIGTDINMIYINVSILNSNPISVSFTDATVEAVDYIETNSSLGLTYIDVKDSVYNNNFYKIDYNERIDYRYIEFNINETTINTLANRHRIDFRFQINTDTYKIFSYDILNNDIKSVIELFILDSGNYFKGLDSEIIKDYNGVDLDLFIKMNDHYSINANLGNGGVTYINSHQSQEITIYDINDNILLNIDASIVNNFSFAGYFRNILNENTKLIRSEYNTNVKRYSIYLIPTPVPSGNISINVNGINYIEPFDTDEHTTFQNFIDNNKHLFEFDLIYYQLGSDYGNNLWKYIDIYIKNDIEYNIIVNGGLAGSMYVIDRSITPNINTTLDTFYRERYEVFKLDLLPVPSGSINFTINNTEYNIPFNTDEQTTLNDFITEYQLINYGNIVSNQYNITHINPDKIGLNIVIDGLDDLFNINSFNGNDVGQLNRTQISAGNRGTHIVSTYLTFQDNPIVNTYDFVTGMNLLIINDSLNGFTNNYGNYVIIGIINNKVYLARERFNTYFLSGSEVLDVKTMDYVTDIREGTGDDDYQLIFEMEDQRNSEFILYDITGEQLTNNGDLTYIGYKPLYGEDGDLPVFLNYDVNRDVNEVKNPFKQQTVFNQIKYNVLNNDAPIDNFLNPVATSVHIGFKGNNEGVSENYLLIKKLRELNIQINTNNSNENNTLNFNTDGSIELTNVNLVRNINSGRLGEIDSTPIPNYTNVLFFDTNLIESVLTSDIETVDFISLGFKTGMNITLYGYDNTNSTNQEIFINNNKTFNILSVTSNIIQTNINFSKMKSQSSYLLKENPLDLLTPIPTAFNITFKTVPNTIGRIHLMGQSEEEDLRLKNMSKLFNCLIDDKDVFIFKEYDINEAGMDWIFLNAKRKEMLLEYPNIFNFIGAYKAPINAIKYFGYNDLILKEYYLDVAKSTSNYKVYHPVTINNYLAGEPDRIDSIERNLPSKKFKKTNLFNLTYKITDFYGDNILQYSNDEILIKLFGLKKLLRRKFLPITAKIVDITGEASSIEVLRDTTFMNTHTTIESNTNMTVVDYDVSAYFSGYNNAYIINIDFKALFPENINYYTMMMKVYAPESKNLIPDMDLVEMITFGYVGGFGEIEIIFKGEEGYASIVNLDMGDTIRIEHSAGNNGLYKIVNDVSGDAEPSFFKYTLKIDKELLDETYIGFTLSDLRFVKISSDVDDNQYTEVEVIKEIFNDLTSYQHVVDGVENPLIEIEVTTENNYGGIYSIRRTITPSYNYTVSN